MSGAVEPIDIDLGKINECHDTLDEESLPCLVNAARVCLERHHDSTLFQPLPGVLSGDELQKALSILWTSPSLAMLGMHHNDEDAAKEGAYALMIVAVFRAMGLKVLWKRPTKDGADWVAEDIGTVPPRKILIEVSGMLDGTTQTNPTNRRLRKKEAALRDGNSGHEGIAFVVDFRPTPLTIHFSRVFPPERTL